MTHIVMTGTDVSMFGPAESETLARFATYAAVLQELESGSRLTYFAIGAPPGSLPLERGNLTIIPLRGLAALYGALRRLPRIGLIACQTLYAEAWLAYAFGRRQRIPVVVQEHTDPFALASPAPLRHCAIGLRRWLGLRLLPLASAVRTVNPQVAERLRPYAHATAQITCLPVPIAIQPLPRAENADAPIVLYAGRLAPEKNLGVLLEATAKSAANMQVVLAGDGPLRDELQHHAARLGVACTITGWQTQEQLAAHYTSASVFVLPSLYEGFGRVLLEAMTCGVPVLASRTAGALYLNGLDEALLLHDPHDVAGFAASLTQLLHDPARRDAQRRKGYLTAARFSRRELSLRWMGLLLGLARKERAA